MLETIGKEIIHAHHGRTQSGSKLDDTFSHCGRLVFHLLLSQMGIFFVGGVESRETLANIFSFLSRCASDYKGEFCEEKDEKPFNKIYIIVAVLLCVVFLALIPVVIVGLRQRQRSR